MNSDYGARSPVGGSRKVANNPPIVTVVTPFYEPAYRGGGPIQTLRAMLKTTPSEFDVQVICSNHDLGVREPLVGCPDQWTNVHGTRVRYTSSNMRDLVRSFRSSDGSAILYLNSFFNWQFSIFPQFLKVVGFWKSADLIIAPRGEFHEGALGTKSKKKQIFLALYRLLRLQNRVVWHASTGSEAADIRRNLGRTVNILTRENDTLLPATSCQRASRTPGHCRLIFASRAVPKKGLHTLLEALLSVSAPYNLEVIGAFEDSKYEGRCLEIISHLPDNAVVSLRGALPRDQVLSKMRDADIMVFPTVGENFGHVIPEALSEACPVMCSTQTPWTELLDAGAGLTVAPNSVSAWADAIQSYALKGPSQWELKSRTAAQGYVRWYSKNKGEHVFNMAMNARANYHKAGN